MLLGRVSIVSILWVILLGMGYKCWAVSRYAIYYKWQYYGWAVQGGAGQGLLGLGGALVQGGVQAVGGLVVRHAYNGNNI